MEKTYIFEGKTTNEAIEKGLKELNVSKSKVDIKVLESEEKRSFFSILTPRVVKVEFKLKEEPTDNKVKKEAKKVDIENIDFEKIKGNIKAFLDDFIKVLPTQNLHYEIKQEVESILITIEGDDIGYLIGYRGETLNSIQNILSNVANKGSNSKARIIVDISGYREKRKKELENLAEKIAHTVIKTRKSITLEPMTAYERKIIHTKLQDSSKVKTYSTGEEPRRKVVVSLK